MQGGVVSLAQVVIHEDCGGRIALAADNDLSCLAVDAVDAVARGNGRGSHRIVQVSHRGVLITDGRIALGGHVGVMGAMVERRQRDARSFDVHLDTDVRLVGVLPLQSGIVACLQRMGVVAADGGVVGR